MDITQTVNISGYSASVCNKIKSVSQVKKTEDVWKKWVSLVLGVILLMNLAVLTKESGQMKN